MTFDPFQKPITQQNELPADMPEELRNILGQIAKLGNGHVEVVKYDMSNGKIQRANNEGPEIPNMDEKVAELLNHLSGAGLPGLDDYASKVLKKLLDLMSDPNAGTTFQDHMKHVGMDQKLIDAVVSFMSRMLLKVFLKDFNQAAIDKLIEDTTVMENLLTMSLVSFHMGTLMKEAAEDVNDDS